MSDTQIFMICSFVQYAPGLILSFLPNAVKSRVQLQSYTMNKCVYWKIHSLKEQSTNEVKMCVSSNRLPQEKRFDAVNSRHACEHISKKKKKEEEELVKLRFE